MQRLQTPTDPAIGRFACNPKVGPIKATTTAEKERPKSNRSAQRVQITPRVQPLRASRLLPAGFATTEKQLIAGAEIGTSTLARTAPRLHAKSKWELGRKSVAARSAFSLRAFRRTRSRRSRVIRGLQRHGRNVLRDVPLNLRENSAYARLTKHPGVRNGAARVRGVRQLSRQRAVSWEKAPCPPVARDQNFTLRARLEGAWIFCPAVSNQLPVSPPHALVIRCNSTERLVRWANNTRPDRRKPRGHTTSERPAPSFMRPDRETVTHLRK